MRAHTHLLSLTALLAGAAAAPPRVCPPLGPVLPAPRNPSAHPLVHATAQALHEAFREHLAVLNHSAVSVGVRSIHEDGPPLLDFHYTPPDAGAERGVKEVDAGTVYRVGSVTKVFTVLAALQLAEKGLLRMDDPVGKWVSELKGGDWEQDDALDRVRWEEVTVDGVATHLSGIGADAFLDLAAFWDKWEDLGLPKIPENVKRPDCSGLGGTKPCTRADIMEAFEHRRPPIYPSYTTPVYSNIGLTLVGLVVEAAAGKEFEDVIRPAIYEPAGMKRTTMSTPLDEKHLFIPTNGTSWKDDLGVIGPAGSMNSNTEDLLSFMTAILKNRLLSPQETRKWFKPATLNAGWAGTVGAPFESYRIDDLTGDGRIIDVITKGGDIIDYHSLITMVPEFGIAVSVLVAGPETSSILPSTILSNILKTLVPVIDRAARDEARERFAGKYVDEKSGSSLEVIVDDGPGLVLKDWVMRGFEVLPNLDRYDILNPGNPDAKPKVSSVRLYPTGLETKTKAAWRAALPVLDDSQAELVDMLAPWKDAHCLQWFATDRKTYNYVALDHFEFVFGEDGLEATGIRVRGFDVDLTKVAKDKDQDENLAFAESERIIADGQKQLVMQPFDFHRL